MEWNGSQRASSSQSEESSLLDLPDDITPESFLLKPNPGKDEAFDLTLPAVDTGKSCYYSCAHLKVTQAKEAACAYKPSEKNLPIKSRNSWAYVAIRLIKH